ncbi:Uncharacterised protein [Mycobacteroides abscessus subsp. bolletii]|uniref:DUF4326 domain-containing protein n=1 Tax=Mycobacteroides abscessus TaxID=36809 RepID=UPI00092AA3E8|nr:DUF4326 domain-containing protein [Mycobacteroides abscessus]QSM90796.1 DUF4326 domain-containing protein [Mycobacteroides abscessus subsp. bolletii]SIJ01898.1 Uncharacterised protein [Mycobacteroides abscessus subsp. bolletii]SLD37089.1 Uncharacterised protein [Mycobacteroides abscessus subsp. bolletii]
MPQRIQRKRTKGWRIPEGAVYVGRPTKWGNPFWVGPNEDLGEVLDAALATKFFRAWLREPEAWVLPKPPDACELRGLDLVCWCPLDSPCHADVLLELANDPPSNGEAS